MQVGGAGEDEFFMRMFRSSPFHEFLRLEVQEPLPAERERLNLRLPFAASLERERGSARFHGGVVAALIDLAGTFAFMRAAGADAPSTSLDVHFLRPATGGDLLAEAVVRRAGRTVGVADVEVTQNGRLVALGRVTLAPGNGGTAD